MPLTSIEMADLKPAENSKVSSRRMRSWAVTGRSRWQGLSWRTLQGLDWHVPSVCQAQAQLRSSGRHDQASSSPRPACSETGMSSSTNVGEALRTARCPGCACCGDPKPVLLRRLGNYYGSMTGPSSRARQLSQCAGVLALCRRQF